MKKIKEIVNRIWKDLKQFWPAAVIFVVYYLIVHWRYDAFCPLLVFAGIPCAGCGLTRAGLYLLQGQIARAAYINPAIFPIIVALIYGGYFRYIRGTKIKGLNLVFGILVGFMLIMYGYRMYLYFPNRVPYVYHKSNVLADFIPHYKELVMRLLSHPTS